MSQLGFVEPGSSPTVVIYAARELNPDFPGIFDLALWDLGHILCRPINRCAECRLSQLCTLRANMTGRSDDALLANRSACSSAAIVDGDD
jgi:adenine-specific DNA glycosylase